MRYLRLVSLYVISFAVSIAPLLIYFIVNKERYVCTRYDGIKLLMGGVVLSFILLLKVMKKLKINSGVSLFGIICVLSYLLAPILQDLMVLSFLALVGEMLDVIVQALISREKRRGLAKEAARDISDSIKGTIGRV